VVHYDYIWFLWKLRIELYGLIAVEGLTGYGLRSDLLQIFGKLGTINNDDLVPWHFVLLDLPVPELP